MSQTRRRVASTGASGALLLGVLLLAPTLGADSDAVGTITARIGAATLAGAEIPLAAPLGVDPEEALATRGNGRLSVLLDENAVVDLCGDTALKVRAEADAGGRAVQLDAGSMRAFVGPRSAEERFEIHTPAAVATILGTVVHVSVDAATKDARIASLDHPVRVQGARGEAVEICCGEEVTVSADGVPGAKRKLQPRELASLGDCFEGLHDAALAAERVAWERQRVRQAARADMPQALPDVAAPPAPPLAVPTEFSPELDPCYATGCEKKPVIPPEPPFEPPEPNDFPNDPNFGDFFPGGP